MDQLVLFAGIPLAAARRLRDIAMTLRPSTVEQFQAAMIPALDLYGIPPTWRRQRPIYCRLLCPFAPDILENAVWHCCATIKWFPKPAEILDAGRPTWQQRRRSLEDEVDRMFPSPCGPECWPRFREWRRQRDEMIAQLLVQR